MINHWKLLSAIFVVIAVSIVVLGLLYGYWQLNEITPYLLAGLFGGVPSAIVYMLKPSPKSLQDKEIKHEALMIHRNTLLSSFQNYDSMIFQDRTLQKFHSDFPYWNKIEQHFQTGHDEIYQPMRRATDSKDIIGKLIENKNEDYETYQSELKKLFHSYDLHTKTLDGACDDCLDYYEKRTRKRFEKILHPDS